jgi:hypothetical protein
MLKLRLIGIRDYSVLEGEQRIGRIRLASERMPSVWLWNVSIHLPGGLPMGSAKDFYRAKVEFRAAWTWTMPVRNRVIVKTRCSCSSGKRASTERA